jgi:hypothetical protein
MYVWVVVALVVLYVAWIGVSRFSSNRELERATKTPISKSVSSAPSQGRRAKIVHFYSGSGQVERGQPALICYGVENAKIVRLIPPVENLPPSPNRCIEAKPDRDTMYTLVASGEDGENVSASFSIQVAPAPPRIGFVNISTQELKRGEPLSICYSVENAKSVRLDPPGMNLDPSGKNCVQVFPAATIEYTLVATSAAGRTDRERFKITVK